MRTISKLTIFVAAAAATAAVVRRYDLLNKGTALAEQGAEMAYAGATWVTGKVVDFVNPFLTEFADKDDLASDPTEEEALVEKLRRERNETAAEYRRSSGDTGPMGYGDVR
jgi:hypothetical protein